MNKHCSQLENVTKELELQTKKHHNTWK